MCSKASRQLNVLYRFKNIFKVEEKKLLYNTFILSNFNHCPIVWHFCSKGDCIKMEKIQERALRFLFNDKKSSYSDLLEKADMDMLQFRRLKTIACEVFKSVNDLNPSFMKDMFIKKEISYNFRDKDKLILPSFKKIRYGKATFSYYGAHLWNLMPVDIKQSMSLNKFKEMLKSWEGPKCKCSMCDFDS